MKYVLTLCQTGVVNVTGTGCEGRFVHDVMD